MKKIINYIFIGLTTLSTYCFADDLDSKSWPERNPISWWVDRANEDWRYVDQLSDDQKTLAEKLKRINLSADGKWKVSFNGNFRIHFVNRWDENFVKDDRVVNNYLTRVFLGSEINYDDLARVYFELRNNESHYDLNSPVDDGGTDVHQLFGEYNFINHSDEKLSARAGRQEILITRFQMGNRELSGVQGSWDALTWKYTRPTYDVNVYWGKEILPVYKNGHWDGNFDDGQTGSKSGGIYSTSHTSYGDFLKYLMITKISNSSFIFADSGWASLRSYGLGLTKYNKTGLGYHIESIYQDGSQEGMPISAYMIYSDINYNWVSDWEWQAGLVSHYATGTKANDKTLHTFNPLWTDDTLDMANTGAYSNVIQTGPYISVNYKPDQTVYLGMLSTWRASTDDAIYTKDQTLLYGADSDHKYAYTQVALRFHNLIATNFKFDCGVLYALDSPYLRDVISSKSSDSFRIEMELTYNL